MTLSKRRVLPFVLALGAVGAMMLASVASASHPRPNSALKIQTALVPAFKQCGTPTNTPNRTHGPPLAAPSCNPPQKASAALINGGSFNGNITIKVLPGNPAPPDDSDVSIVANMQDVRCDNDGIGDSTNCGAANASGGPDYTGNVRGTATIRISDHWNATAAGGGTDPATVADLPFPVVATCTATAPTNIGSTCGVTTTANAVVGGPLPTVKDNQRAVVEVTQLIVQDGGVNGTTYTDPFVIQGIFIP
jgi:hypothetical protein